MLTHWLSQSKGKVCNMLEDNRILALHVLSAAGFGVSHDFLEGARKPDKGHTMSHKDSLMTILRHLVAAIVLSQMPWLKPVVPKRFQEVVVAVEEFRSYMDEMLAHERVTMKNDGRNSKPNLISTLIRTSDTAQADGIQSAVRLSDEEIKGNIFIFNLAGHDTTANTLTYAFALLATNPAIQDWVIEEVDVVLEGVENPDYAKVFPRLKRVMAVMVSADSFVISSSCWLS
jgi:cytochrome P450